MYLVLTTHPERQSPFRHSVSGAWESHGWKNFSSCQDYVDDQLA